MFFSEGQIANSGFRQDWLGGIESCWYLVVIEAVCATFVRDPNQACIAQRGSGFLCLEDMFRAVRSCAKVVRERK